MQNKKSGSFYIKFNIIITLIILTLQCYAQTEIPVQGENDKNQEISSSNFRLSQHHSTQLLEINTIFKSSIINHHDTIIINSKDSLVVILGFKHKSVIPKNFSIEINDTNNCNSYFYILPSPRLINDTVLEFSIPCSDIIKTGISRGEICFDFGIYVPDSPVKRLNMALSYKTIHFINNDIIKTQAQTQIFTKTINGFHQNEGDSIIQPSTDFLNIEVYNCNKDCEWIKLHLKGEITKLCQNIHYLKADENAYPFLYKKTAKEAEPNIYQRQWFTAAYTTILTNNRENPLKDEFSSESNFCNASFIIDSSIINKAKLYNLQELNIEIETSTGRIIELKYPIIYKEWYKGVPPDQWGKYYKFYTSINGKRRTGLMDENKQLVYPALFYRLIRTIAIKQVDSTFKYGIFDYDLTQKTAFKYDRLLQDGDNFIFQLNNKWGLMTKNEDILIDNHYESIQSTGKNTYLVSFFKEDNTLKYGLIDKHDNKLSKFKYDRIIDHNQLLVKTKDKWGILNHKGEKLTKIKYDSILRHTGERYFSMLYKGKWGLFDPNGKLAIKPTYNKPLLVIEGLIKIQNNDSKVGYIDVDGKTVIECTYDKIEKFGKSKFTIVKRNNKFGVIDLEGREIIPIHYDTIKRGDLTSVFIVKQDDKWMYYNGAELISNEHFLVARKFTPYNVALVKLDFLWFLIDKNGELLHHPSLNIINEKMDVYIQNKLFPSFGNTNYICDCNIFEGDLTLIDKESKEKIQIRVRFCRDNGRAEIVR